MRTLALVRLGAALALASAVALATASAALADSTLIVRSDSSVGITAAAGKANVMTITINGASLTVTDSADPINAPAPCTGSGTTTVVCSLAAPIPRLDADVKDLNDSLRVDTSALVVLYGGDGSDEVTAAALPGAAQDSTNLNGDDPETDPAGDGDDRLIGGDFRDFIEGGGGRDTLVGGAGDDTLRPDAGDADSADGGPGDDSVTWRVGEGSGETLEGGPGLDTLSVRGTEFAAPFTTALSADLVSGAVRQTAGGAASATATGFENAENAGASATLVGTDGPNVLTTGTADDTVTAGSGADLVEVDDGADRIFVRDGFGDRVRCGRGADTVEADQFDELYDCEDVARVAILPPGVDRAAPVCTVRGVAARVRRKRFLKGVRPSITCNEAAALEARLTVRVRRRRGRLVTARAGDLVLADRVLPLAADARRITLKVPRALRRVLGRRFSVRLTVVARDEFGNASRVAQMVRVR